MLILYIDPGTGSMLISALIATLSVVFFALKDKIYTLFGNKGDEGEQIDLNKKYGLVYYSEGKQYWNVFKPLLFEGSSRNIEAMYLTSDSDDPGLNYSISGVTPVYIGTGREAYYKLNRLKADMVVMTTPGLDVLEIKRSKEVKHYSHISHSVSSFASYKTFSVDYFDSVLVGGDAEVELIRELEKFRNSQTKNIKVIGHTYLDELRKNIKNNEFEYTFFEKRRPTVLVSPTWGDHGLLTKYGDELLSKLEKEEKYNVIIRPHPQSFISDKEVMDDLLEKYPNNESRIWNTDRENLHAMFHADIMISDFSGIIFDYFTLFKKPILTMNSQFEKRGREAMDLKSEPWDHKLLNVIGRTIGEEDIDNIINILDESIDHYDLDEKKLKDISRTINKHPNNSAILGIDFIEEILASLHIKNLEQKEQCNELFDNNFILKEFSLKNFSKAIFKPELLFQAIMATVLLLSYIFVGIKVLPNPGLNISYLIALKNYIIFVLIGLSSIFLVSLWTINKGKFNLIKDKEVFDWNELLILSLPMTPILQYIILNQDILKLKDSLLVFLVFVLISFIIVIVIPHILSPVISKTFTKSISLPFIFVIFNMASFGKVTRNRNITLIFIAIALIYFILSFIKRLPIALMISVVLFISNTGSTIINKDNHQITENISERNQNLFEYLSNFEIKNKPNVYLLVYDSYVNEETMEYYGIDNSSQYEYLLDNGFVIYDGTYSLGADSLSSMAQVLNFGPSSNTRLDISQDSFSLNFFKRNFYDTYYIFENDYLFSGYEPGYKKGYPELSNSIAPYKIITKAILEGEFRFDVDFSTGSRDDFLENKSKLLSENNNNLKFVYEHSNNPNHSQNSGVLLPNETELYYERLQLANEEMVTDLNNIWNNNNNNEDIIIIMGDHGPYLTKNGIGLGSDYSTEEINKYDVQDRFGAFLSIKWPDKSNVSEYQINTIQEVIPAIISYMYDDISIYNELKPLSIVNKNYTISDVAIDNDIIIGGIDDQEPLFDVKGIRKR